MSLLWMFCGLNLKINDDSIQAENVESNIKEEAEMNLTGICGIYLSTA